MIGLILYSYLSTTVVFYVFFRQVVVKSDAPTHTIFWIILMYIITPVLREVVRERKYLKQIIVTIIILGVVVAQFRDVPHLSTLSSIIYSSKVLLFSLLFYLLGYYLATENIKIKKRYLVLGIIVSYSVNFLYMFVGLENVNTIPFVGRFHIYSAIGIFDIVISCAMYL